MWGWAFNSVGAPCVAQRVCAMPVAPESFCSPTWKASSATRPAERTRRSSGLAAPISTATMSRFAAAPTIPHMALPFPRRLPGRKRHLLRARHGELPRRRVLADGGARTDVGAPRDPHRRDQRSVRADEAVVFDHRAVLLRAV